MSEPAARIVEAVRALSPAELRELWEALERESSLPGRPALVAEVRGKYAHVPTSSDGFASRKAEEIALEERRSQL